MEHGSRFAEQGARAGLTGCRVERLQPVAEPVSDITLAPASDLEGVLAAPDGALRPFNAQRSFKAQPNRLASASSGFSPVYTEESATTQQRHWSWVYKVTGRFQVKWMDDFHMNYAHMSSEGIATARGFSVLGHYDVASDAPRWRWRTDYDLVDDDRLIITAYIIKPDGQEAKAVETAYVRRGASCPHLPAE